MPSDTPAPGANDVADVEYKFYDRFFFSRNVEPYATQEQAFAHVFAGRDVMVTVPTGTGKTMVGKAALFRALETGRTAIYTSPLRALTEEKFREFCEDFGEDNVGFATGDYRVRPKAPLQVVVAEILWNQIYGSHASRPADVVVMDEAHYFNDLERGYVWEQSIISLDARTQLVLLSATVGAVEGFCNWVHIVRGVEMALVQSTERKVPLHHEFREETLVETVKTLAIQGDVPAIVFVFGREMCFETARILRTCRRFLTDAEREEVTRRANDVLMARGAAAELRPMLLHGIGIHHAGILPRYKRLVEELTNERLLKVVVSTETISAGINLPAKCVVFPSLKKVIQAKPRMLTSAEYHQMAGRAGRPQFDTEGFAITLAPEEITLELKRELQKAKQSRFEFDLQKLRKSLYGRARAEARSNGDVTWDPDNHAALVAGRPAALTSRTRVTADQVLAIGLPTGDPLGSGADAARAAEPPSVSPDIYKVIDRLLLDDRGRQEARDRARWVTENLQALGVVDEAGRHVKGEIVGTLHGMDGLFVFYALRDREMTYEFVREMVEYLVEHEAIQRVLQRAIDSEKREWCRTRLRERRRDEPQVSMEDVEAEYDEKFPRELTEIEKLHGEFLALLPHPELNGGKTAKTIWRDIEDEQLSFADYVERHALAHEEGSLFTYLARVMKAARMLSETTGLPEFAEVEARVRNVLGVVDERVTLDRD